MSSRLINPRHLWTPSLLLLILIVVGLLLWRPSIGPTRDGKTPREAETVQPGQNRTNTSGTKLTIRKKRDDSDRGGANDLNLRIAELVEADAAGNRPQVIKLLLDLVKQDPILALETMTTLPHDYGSWVAVELHRMCVEGDPQGAAAWLTAFRPKTSHELRLASNVLGLLADHDPALAFESLETFSAKQKRVLLASGAISVWAQGDPLGALQEANLHLAGENLEIAKSMIITSLAHSDPDQALTLAKDLDGDYGKQALLNIYAAILLRKGSSAALEALMHADPAIMQQALGTNRLIETAAKENPNAAMDALSKLAFTDSNSFLFERAAGIMAAQSLTSTNEWISTFPEGPAKRKLESAAMRGLAAENPDAALEAFGKLDASFRSGELDGLARGLGEAGGVDHISKVLPDLGPEEQTTLLATFAGSLSSRDPEAAISFLTSDSLPKFATSSDDVSRELANAAAQAAKKDPDLVLSQIELTPKAQQPSVIRGLITGWASTDAEAASRWLNELPNGIARDEGISALIKQIENTDPETADQWRLSLSQPTDHNK